MGNDDLRNLLLTRSEDPRRPPRRPDPRASRPRRDGLDADALPRSERPGLGGRHRPVDDVIGCAAASCPTVGRAGVRGLGNPRPPSIDSVLQAHSYECGEGCHHNPANCGKDGRLKLCYPVENDRDNVRCRPRTDQEPKERCTNRGGPFRHEPLHAPILAQSLRAGESRTRISLGQPVLARRDGAATLIGWALGTYTPFPNSSIGGASIAGRTRLSSSASRPSG
jgi:hypothetical protein